MLKSNRFPNSLNRSLCYSKKLSQTIDTNKQCIQPVCCVIIRSFCFLQLEKVELCIDNYLLSEFIINITSEVHSWHQIVYPNSSLASDISGEAISVVVLNERIVPNVTYSITVYATNEFGQGTPSTELKLCELVLDTN